MLFFSTTADKIHISAISKYLLDAIGIFNMDRKGSVYVKVKAQKAHCDSKIYVYAAAWI